MEWFKHYNNASDGESCQLLISQKDYETLYIYWWLLEQISKLEKEDSRGKVTLNFSYFKMKLGLNFQRTSRVLLKIAKTFNLEIIQNLDETVEVFAPKWLELQENRGGKRSPKVLANIGQKTTELRTKNKELRTKNKELNTISTEPQSAVSVQDDKNKSLIVLTKSKQFILKTELLNSWSETYPQEFLQLSLKEMKNWILVNEAKCPKSNWGRFMNSWFQRGWERHRKTMASNPTSKISAEDLNNWINEDKNENN